jgi:hypothetical protein
MTSYHDFLEDLVNDLVTSDEVDLTRLVGEFEFQGFDPSRLYQSLAKREKNGKVLLEDVRVLCIVLITRGTSLDKIKSRSTPDAASKLNKLIQKYSVSKSGRGKGPDVVTLARIGATFPYYCVMIANKAGIQSKIPEFKGMKPEGLFVPQLAGLVPRTGAFYDQLFIVLKHISVCFQHMIKPDSTQADYERNFGFMEIQRKSPLGSDAERTQWLADLSIIAEVNDTIVLNFDPDAIISANTYYKV